MMSIVVCLFYAELHACMPVGEVDCGWLNLDIAVLWPVFCFPFSGL